MSVNQGTSSHALWAQKDILTRWVVADSQKAHTLADLHGHPPIRVD